MPSSFPHNAISLGTSHPGTSVNYECCHSMAREAAPQLARRTAPLPAGAMPWSIVTRVGVLHMCWQDLAFFHWPIEPALLDHLLPGGLLLDTFEGRAWLGITPFRMTQVRPAWCPSLPGISTFPELNVRTYVMADGIPGIWFFSLDATQTLAVRTARMLLNLPYHYGRATIETDQCGVRWHSARSGRRWPPARFAANYRPISEIYYSRPGHLDYWLTERYCLYTANSDGRVFRQAISHHPWPLQDADAEVLENTMLEADGLPPADGPPLVHFARQVDVWACLPEAV
jgi:uncharacterized protein YqjF (DUF2071 family)